MEESSGGFKQGASDAGRKVIALVILLAAGWILFKLTLGFLAGLLWIVIAVLAVVAIVWAIRVL